MSLHRHRHKSDAGDLELTTFLNVLVVLISFLLLSAVFSRIAIQELKLPTAPDPAILVMDDANRPQPRLDVDRGAGRFRAVHAEPREHQRQR